MSDNTWNPSQYMSGNMGNLRTRPALDLLAKVPVVQATGVYDLGCGPGNSTAPLKSRWPDAHITGVDNSQAMLDKAAQSHPELNFQIGDISNWSPETKADVIFANASIHWVPDHGALLPHLLGHLNAGGCLAIQQPNNFAAPSHTLIGAIAAQDRFSRQLEGKLLGDYVQDVRFYHDLLRPLAGNLDIWETEYAQPLTGEDPVLEWVRGTTLLPVKTNLSEEDYAAFEAIYRAALRQAYPMADDGITLFPFRRMFMIATAR